ncbi:MAG: hypothetical protein ACJA0Y_002382 [Maricaulis maris]|jgi:hypothetical protein
MIQSNDRIVDGLRWLCLAIAAPQLGYAWLWAFMDVFGRLGMWPGTWTWFDLAGFLATVSLGSELAFAGFVILYTTGVIRLLQRRTAAPIFVVALMLNQFDWILLSLNNFQSESLAGLMELVGLIILIPIVWICDRNWQARRQ